MQAPCSRQEPQSKPARKIEHSSYQPSPERRQPHCGRSAYLPQLDQLFTAESSHDRHHGRAEGAGGRCIRGASDRVASKSRGGQAYEHRGAIIEQVGFCGSLRACRVDLLCDSQPPRAAKAELPSHRDGDSRRMQQHTGEPHISTSIGI